MTVKELMDKLSKFDPNARVMVDYTDDTDWRYTISFDEIELGTPEYYSVGEEEFNDEGDFIGKEVVLIPMGI